MKIHMTADSEHSRTTCGLVIQRTHVGKKRWPRNHDRRTRNEPTEHRLITCGDWEQVTCEQCKATKRTRRNRTLVHAVSDDRDQTKCGMNDQENAQERKHLPTRNQ